LLLLLFTADGIGKSDPYVKFTLIKDNFGPFDTKFGTQESSHKMNDLNPTYNEEFIFHGTPDSLENLVLEVEVFDDDIGRDDKLGKCKIKLADIDGNLFGNYLHVEKKIDNKWFGRDAKIFLKIKMSK
jgi:Ca2+-dependent lipid-binding protein